jgi:Fe-S cluster assembly protein SufB
MAATVETAQTVKEVAERKYKYGFVTEIESETAPKGLGEEVIGFISAKKGEPDWLLEWRLKAYRHWLTMPEPLWANVTFDALDYQDAYYYSAPKTAEGPKSLEEVDPELLRTYEKLGIPLREQEMLAGVAVDAVFDSVSVATTFKKKLHEVGVIFCSISEAVQTHPELVREYLGSVVPYADNKHATLNSAVFTDGSFVYVPKGVRCPMELSTYFRINAANTGQFERTLIIADEGSYVSYLEGCTAPMRDEHQLHAAVVELVALKDAEIKYSTVQNWYPGDEEGRGGIFNFVTKRGACITNNMQQADTGTKMIHLGKNTRSRIIAKGIPKAHGARNHTQCDSLLIGERCGAHTVPYIESKNRSARVEHEATTSKISEDQLFYCRQRGIGEEEAVALVVNGFCREVLQQLPMEFAVEAQKLVGISLEGSVG